MKLVKRKIMLDGMLTGTKLESAVEIPGSDLEALRKILIACGAEAKGEGMYLVVRGNSGAVIELRKNRYNGGFFMNLSGNPLTFLTGRNTYGSPEADKQIVAVYKRCIAYLESESKMEVPGNIKDAVEEMDIYINNIEFACYTIPVENKDKVLDAWYHVYTTGYSHEGARHIPLVEKLNLKIAREHKTHTSVCLRILSGDGREEEAQLEAYDKADEMRSKGLEVGADIENRIRLDLCLTYGWFRRRQVGQRKLKTLADLVAYIQKNCGGNWLIFLASEFQWALNRTCLFHMWEFDHQPILDKSYEVGQPGFKKLSWATYFAMLDARARLAVSDEDRRQFLLGNYGPLSANLRLEPHPVVISLDMGVVKKGNADDAG